MQCSFSFIIIITNNREVEKVASSGRSLCQTCSFIKCAFVIIHIFNLIRFEWATTEQYMYSVHVQYLCGRQNQVCST